MNDQNPQCLACDRRLPRPGESQRYCPYCGAMRVMPESRAGGARDAYLIVGSDVIGPRTGAVFVYEKPNCAPREIAPLTGVVAPHDSLNGNHKWDREWPDLFACEGTPFPESSGIVYRMPSWLADGGAPRDLSLHAELAQVALRHGRLFILGASGRVSAIDTRRMTLVGNWSYPEWGKTDTLYLPRLHVSETLLYGIHASGGHFQVKAAEVGRGRPCIDLPVPSMNAQVLIARGELIIVHGPQAQQQRVERYRLEDFEHSLRAEPHRRIELPAATVLSSTPSRPIRIGADLVITAADGKIYRWGPEANAVPEVLWPNLDGVVIQGDPIPLGASEFGLVADGAGRGGRVSLIRIGVSRLGQAELREPLELWVVASARERHHVTAAAGRLYIAAQPAGEPLQIYSLDLTKQQAPVELVTSFPSTEDANLAQFMTVPWKGTAGVLVHYEMGSQRRIWIASTSMSTPEGVGGQPAQAHRMRVLWETGGLWLVNLTEGRIAPLS